MYIHTELELSRKSLLGILHGFHRLSLKLYASSSFLAFCQLMCRPLGTELKLVEEKDRQNE